MATKPQPQPLKNSPSLETVEQYLDAQDAELVETYNHLTGKLSDIFGRLRGDIAAFRERVREASVLAGELNQVFGDAADRIERSLNPPAEPPAQS